MISIEICR